MRNPNGTRRGASVRTAVWTAAALAAAALIPACSGDAGSNLSGPTNTKVATTLPTFGDFKAALVAAQQENNGGLGFNMWGTIVDREGVVKAVVFTGDSPVDQWPGSRVISAQKANTANDFSLTAFSLSTANLYAATQPGGSLFGLQESNPVDITVAYEGKLEDYGTEKDALVGKKIGGVNVFGGGLALYAPDGSLIGALGVSGDASCADHIIAWKTRHALHLDYVPAGVANGGLNANPNNTAGSTDNIIFDIGANGSSASGFGHPICDNPPAAASETSMQFIAEHLPQTNPIPQVVP
ncbi:MAG TPA: heme-binding protein [Gemmatimonadales bacterium]|nr:heme-binding protein [Gemmatimonadales bacterium]